MNNRITIWLCCFCFSATSAVFWPQLPSKESIAVILSIVIIFSVIMLITLLKEHRQKTERKLSQSVVILHGLMAGTLWLASVGHLHYAWQLPNDKIQQDVTIQARVLSGGCATSDRLDEQAEVQNERMYYYVVQINNFNQRPAKDVLNSSSTHWFVSAFKARLSHNTAQRGQTKTHGTFNKCLKDGDVFSARVKLKPAYGVANPLGFNQQKLLVNQGIHATGYIKWVDANSIQSSVSFRSLLVQHITSLDLVNRQWWLALLLGVRSELDFKDWRLLQRTGTGHLFSISGMHLGIVAASLLWIINSLVLVTRWLYIAFVGRPRVTQHATTRWGAVEHGAVKRGAVKCGSMPANVSTGLASFIRVVNVAPIRTSVLLSITVFAFCYAAISGMALPVVRAFVLLCIACLLSLGYGTARPLHAGLIMLFALIVLFPLGTLGASFYLSVIAVFIIWYLHRSLRFSQKSWFAAAFQIQWYLSVLLVPVSLLWFGSASVVSVIANIVAVPIVTLILPVTLLSLMTLPVTPLLSVVFRLADVVLTWLLAFLDYLSEQHFAIFEISINTPQSWCILGIAILCFLPHFQCKKFLVILLAIPVFLIKLPSNDKHWQMHVFDAGQASAIAFTKGNRAIVVDSGAKYNGYAKTAEAHLLPLLRAHGIHVIDHVFHTHSDLDHAGGLEVITQSPLASNAVFYSPISGCERGKIIKWQQLSIAVLWPREGNKEDSNAQSCVLHISDGHQSVLIAGDIERASEYALVTEHINTAQLRGLKADVLVAPHHGSRTSSTGAFIKAVAPQAVIYTQGFENRWGFPAKQVVERYSARKVKQYLTSVTGYIRVSFQQSDLTENHEATNISPRSFKIETQRTHIAKHWYMPAYFPRHL